MEGFAALHPKLMRRLRRHGESKEPDDRQILLLLPAIAIFLFNAERTRILFVPLAGGQRSRFPAKITQ
jgi:hypothetical protein